jgi:hypothetical protein
VLLLTSTPVPAVVPNITVTVPLQNWVPVIVTVVPPAVVPLLGETLVTVGTGEV